MKIKPGKYSIKGTDYFVIIGEESTTGRELDMLSLSHTAERAINLQDFIYKVKKDGVVPEDLIKSNGGWEYIYDQAQRYETHPLG